MRELELPAIHLLSQRCRRRFPPFSSFHAPLYPLNVHTRTCERHSCPLSLLRNSQCIVGLDVCVCGRVQCETLYSFSASLKLMDVCFIQLHTCTNRTRVERRLRFVLFLLLICAQVHTIACVNEELKCKLLILFCSGEGGGGEMAWNSECEIRFESFPTSHGSTINVCQDCGNVTNLTAPIFSTLATLLSGGGFLHSSR